MLLVLGAPCQLVVLAGPEHGRTIPLTDIGGESRSRASLALFSVPVIILEPVKPVAAYLAATGQIMSSVLTLIVGELLKLVLIER